MKQTGLPQIPEDLVILPIEYFKPILTGMKIKVVGIDELEFPFDIRSLETAIPRSPEDRQAVAARIGKLVENTVLHIMGLPTKDVL